MKQLILPREFSGEEFITLPAEDSHYLIRVQRLSVGDKLKFKSRSGESYLGEILKCEDGAVSVKLEKNQSADSKSNEIYLFQCIPKGKKIDLIIRQAVEAGVSKIFPIMSDHAVPSFKNDGDKVKKRDRWEKVVKEAAQQSNTTELTEIQPLLTMEEAIKTIEDEFTGLFFHQVKVQETNLHKSLETCEKRVVIVIGPEGGLSEREVELLKKYNFTPILLGDNILRAETAATFALGAVNMILLERNFWKAV